MEGWCRFLADELDACGSLFISVINTVIDMVIARVSTNDRATVRWNDEVLTMLTIGMSFQLQQDTTTETKTTKTTKAPKTTKTTKTTTTTTH